MKITLNNFEKEDGVYEIPSVKFFYNDYREQEDGDEEIHGTISLNGEEVGMFTTTVKDDTAIMDSKLLTDHPHGELHIVQEFEPSSLPDVASVSIIVNDTNGLDGEYINIKQVFSAQTVISRL